MEREKAIEVIRKNWPDPSFTQLQEALETLIPELRESEDERARKGLINFLNQPSIADKITFDAKILWLDWLEKQKEQNSAEVDESTKRLNDNWMKQHFDDYEEQKSAEWSEEDKEILGMIRDAVNSYWSYNKKQKLFAWISHLPERINLQPKQEWSEEDEKKIIELKTFIARCNGFNKENRKKAFDMIDAIGPKPSWKPSEEQMGALSWMLENARGNIDFDSLKDLYKQLKKLM